MGTIPQKCFSVFLGVFIVSSILSMVFLSAVRAHKLVKKSVYNLRKLSQASSLKFFIGLLVCVAFLAVLICNGWIPYTPTAVLMIPSEPPVDQTMRDIELSNMINRSENVSDPTRIDLDNKLDHSQEELDHANPTLPVDTTTVKLTSTGKKIVDKSSSPTMAPQTDGKVVQPTSPTKYQTELGGLETAPIKIDGIPLEKVNTNYTHNIYFSVKSSGAKYKSRLLQLMLTWFQVVDKDKLAIISDNSPAGKPYLDTIKKTGFDVVLSSCQDDHSHGGLCCKAGIEFSSYYNALEKHRDNQDRYQWYCHFDDDMYVNVPQLSLVLQQYDPSKPYYIGKYPWRLRNYVPYVLVTDKTKARIKSWIKLKADHYQYATGSTYCVSHALIMKGKDLLNGRHKFTESCLLAGHADDITVGFILGAILGCNLTEIDHLYNQFDKLNEQSFSMEELSKFLTVSYLENEVTHKITRTVPLQSVIKGDTTKFMAYHCLLYPTVSWCPKET